MEYENARKLILDVFQWEAPTMRNRVFRGAWGSGVGTWCCDDPLAVHKFCSTYPAFEFQARPVIARRGRYPGRARSDCLARRTEAQLSIQGGALSFVASPTLSRSSSSCR